MVWEELVGQIEYFGWVFVKAIIIELDEYWVADRTCNIAEMASITLNMMILIIMLVKTQDRKEGVSGKKFECLTGGVMGSNLAQS